MLFVAVYLRLMGLSPGSMPIRAHFGLSPNVQLAQSLDVTLTDFFVYTFTGGEPTGTYAAIALFTPPGAFDDGRVDGRPPGD